MRLFSENSRKWIILAAVGVSVGMILLDETGMAVALPSIQRDLNLSLTASHWVINSYLLVFAGLAAAAGKLGDIIGLRRLFILGVVVFGLASLAAGFAQTGAWIIGARAVQGVGAAMVFPLTLAMISISFPARQRGMALGLRGAIGTVFLGLGPLAGGFLTDAFSWRWFFWINPVLAAAVALMVQAVWTDQAEVRDRAKFDTPGLLLLVSGLGLFVFALMQGPAWDWSALALGLLLAGLVLGAAFVLVERRSAAPLIDVNLFGSATFSTCALVIFAGQFSKIAVIVFGSLYLQHELKMRPFEAGLGLVAAVGPVMFTAAVSGKLADRFGSRLPIIGGLAVYSFAFLWIGVALAYDSYWLLLPALLVSGAANPFLFMPPQRAIFNAASPSQQGEAGGVAMTSQLLGGTIGMAVCSTLFAASGSYRLVFLAPTALMFAVLLLGWLAIDPAKSRVGEPAKLGGAR